ncbi:BON domain-containing protein [Galbitalea soli]|uniref:BON domain-containing protein n=1 Tax=Galbitalea soli TaxID=1268042 RepID=A0A7C9TN10_9MICO|nr:BON domain-containing protein [Galbitalea soli]NEM90076.1 BON domain-containing protein [Galbitalea soli]NYJ30783.1 osmotically-inducible protein OsmY [Galbitalea soli]
MNTTSAVDSDRTVQKLVSDELRWTAELNSAGVGVSVNRGAVTLSGEVATLRERIAAREAALRVKGVSTVADEMTVAAPDEHRTDTDVAAAVRTILLWNTLVPKDAIKATVRAGTVVLTGVVDWDYQRHAAELAVSSLNGVRFVDNQINLTRHPSAPDTKEAIHNALVRNAILDSRGIDVSVAGNEVTLTGEVSSWAEKKQAGHAAWAAPHVTDVHNNLVVRPI